MLKSTRIVWVIMLVLVLVLFTGCTTDPGDGDDGIEYSDDELESARDFIISDLFPYPGKKPDCTVLNKPINTNHSIYIYVINKGENWRKNDVRDIKVTYYDNTRPGETVVYDEIYVLKHQGNTYIRVDNIRYPVDARGYFRAEGEIKQGSHWYAKSANSNLFNYGDPTSIPLPINRDYILYEKEYVD